MSSAAIPTAGSDKSSAGAPGFSAAYSWYVFILLFLLMMSDFMDRQVIASILPFIKQEYGATDTQLGLLISIVNFIMVVVTVPASILIDRWSRRKAVAIMAMVWSAATAACGFATTYMQLLIFRGLVGSGEAAYNPGAVSILTAVFPPHRRATVLGALQAAASLGSVLGLMAGGWIAVNLGWRHAFGIVAIPGFFLAVLIWFTREYKTVKLETVDSKTGQATQLGLGASLLGILRTPTLMWLYVGNAGQLFFSATMLNWLPSYYVRFEQLPADQAAFRASVYMVAGFVGIIFGGMIVDRWAAKMPRAKLLANCLFSLATVAVFATAFIFFGGQTQYVLILLGGLITSGGIGAAYAVTQEVAHPGIRATSTSGMIFAQNLFGMALGPLITGMLSDRFDLLTALAIVSFVPLIAVAAFYLGSRSYDRDAGKVANVSLALE